jgi:hypothetical protein
MNAETVNDLVIHSEERQVLWRALRERAQRSQTYAMADLPDLDLDPQVMAMLLGFLDEASS